MKKLFYIFLLLALGVGIGYLIFNPQPTPIKELNFAKPSPTPNVIKMKMDKNTSAASFGIVTNGNFWTFAHTMYHNQDDEVYIEPKNPNIVIIKNPSRTWDYFFKTLPFLLKRDCLTTGTGQSFCTDEVSRLKFYIDGVEDPDALNKTIKHKSKFLVVYGNGDIQNYLKQIPTIE